MENSINEDDIPRIGNTVLKEEEFILDHLFKKYKLKIQLRDEDIIFISAIEIDSEINFNYKMKYRYEEFQNLGDLLNPLLYKNINSIYEFLLDSFKEKIIFIKEIINKNSLTLSVKYKMPGKKILSVDIPFLEKNLILMN